MHRCLISLGANLGNPIEAIRGAATLLKTEFGGNAFQLSALFRTPPVGGPSGQPPFVNAVAALETSLDPWDAWRIVRKIEAQLGRVRERRWEARNIDLDILLFGDVRIWTPQLKIPHPRMCMRRFILAPARQVAADWLDPVSQRSIGQLAEALQVGAGNLVLYAQPGLRAKPLLEEAARIGIAGWRQFPSQDAEQPAPPDIASRPLADSNPSEGRSRWVALIESELDAAQTPRLACETRLSVFLAPPMARQGAVWEDDHQSLAAALRLAETPAAAEIAVRGPRYLLAADDPRWAVHELVSALDAMDCPIEMSEEKGAGLNNA